MIDKRRSSVVIGHQAVLLAKQALMAAGWHVAQPEVDLGYDVVASQDGVAWRKIQVKAIGHDSLSASIMRSNGRYYKPTLQVDDFLLVHLDSGTIWWFNALDWFGTKTINVRPHKPWFIGRWDPRGPWSGAEETYRPTTPRAAGGRKAQAVFTPSKVTYADKGIYQLARTCIAEARPQWMEEWVWQAIGMFREGKTVGQMVSKIGRVSEVIRWQVTQDLDRLTTQEAVEAHQLAN